MFQSRIHGELNIFGQKIVFPTAVHINDTFAYHKARAGNSAVRAADKAGIVQELRFTDEPKRIACAYPVCAVVFAVSVRCTSLITRVKCLVHFKNIVVLYNIVGVKNKECFDSFIRVFGIYSVKNEIKRIAFSDMSL